jgi:hypothetical protein
MEAITLFPGPKNDWILEHFAGDSTIMRRMYSLKRI